MSDDRRPIESRAWPDRLPARAVFENPDERRIHGYDVERDLARHYGFSDVLLLSLTGELQDDGRRRAFGIALNFASAVSVASAPIHAAMLARLCGCRTSGVLSVATMALAEPIEETFARVDEMLRALDEGERIAWPDDFRAQGASERASVTRLSTLVGDAVSVPAFSFDPSREIALIAVLRACGLRSAFSAVSALTVARLPSALAEASATKPADFRSYPMDSPKFVYDAPPNDEAREP